MRLKPWGPDMVWTAAAACEETGRRALQLFALLSAEALREQQLGTGTGGEADFTQRLRHVLGELEQYEAACANVRTAVDGTSAVEHVAQRCRLCASMPSELQEAIDATLDIIDVQQERQGHIATALSLLLSLAPDLSRHPQGDSTANDELEAGIDDIHADVDDRDVTGATRDLQTALEQFAHTHTVEVQPHTEGLSEEAAAPSTTMGSDLRATLEGLRALSAECVDMVELLLAGDSAAAALAATHSERAERTARLENTLRQQLDAAQAARAELWRAGHRFLRVKGTHVRGRAALLISSAGASLLVEEAAGLVADHRHDSIEGGKVLLQMLRAKLQEVRRTPDVEAVAASLLRKLQRCSRTMRKLRTKQRHYENRRSELVEFSRIESSDGSDGDPDDNVSDDEFNMYALEDVDQKLVEVRAQLAERRARSAQMRMQLQKLVLILPELRFEPALLERAASEEHGADATGRDLTLSTLSNTADNDDLVRKLAGVSNSSTDMADTLSLRSIYSPSKAHHTSAMPRTKAELRQRQREILAERAELERSLQLMGSGV